VILAGFVSKWPLIKKTRPKRFDRFFVLISQFNVGYRPQPNECTHCRECEIIFLLFIAISQQ